MCGEAGASDTTRLCHRASGRQVGHHRSPPGTRRLVTGPEQYIRAMKAVVVTDTGGPDVLRVQEWPDPQVGPGDVRIAVRAAGLNFADTMARTGFYPNAPKPPSQVLSVEATPCSQGGSTCISV